MSRPWKLILADNWHGWLMSSPQPRQRERVWLMGRTPMGAADVFHDGSNYFGQIVTRYEATIAAMFFGHTHRDDFEITYTNYSARSASSALQVSYITPALTPTSGHPTFRVYSVDPVTFGVLDYTVYVAHMSCPTWEKYYPIKATYGAQLSLSVNDPSSELTPAFWHNVTVLFENEDAVYQAHNARRSRGWDAASCTGDCKTKEICQLRAGKSAFNCASIKPGVNFKKRDLPKSNTMLTPTSVMVR